jgi:hypothetical protein
MTDAEIKSIWMKVATYDTHLSDVLAFARAIEDALLQSSIPPEPQAGAELTDDEVAAIEGPRFKAWLELHYPYVSIGSFDYMMAWDGWKARALNQRQAVKAEPHI